MTDEQKRLEMYDRVNKCETLEDLQGCIIDLADEEGMIQGRTRKFNAIQMSNNLEKYMNGTGEYSPNVITREFNLRQQAMYIKYYYCD